MTAFIAANLTKYNAGGSGDNVVSDGYIKTVEKVWLDSFAFTSVITTADTIAIASIPPNKKITGVEVTLPATWASTATTINVGISGDTDKFIDAAVLTNSKEKVIRMNNNDGMQYVTVGTTNTTIYLSVGTAITAPTAGTLKTVVKYT